MAKNQNDASNKKQTEVTNNNIAVRKSELKKLENAKNTADAKNKTQSKQNSQLSALEKRRNEIIERRTRALAQAKKSKGTVAKSGAGKELKDGEKRPNVFVRAGRFIKKKFKEMFSELKKVTWPTNKDAVRQTLVVLGVVACFLVVLLFMDLGLSTLLDLLINKGA